MDSIRNTIEQHVSAHFLVQFLAFKLNSQLVNNQQANISMSASSLGWTTLPCHLTCYSIEVTSATRRNTTTTTTHNSQGTEMRK